MKKKLLLFTCDTLADTKQISFAYIFKSSGKDHDPTYYNKYREQCSGPFGAIMETDHPTQKWYINCFQGGKGFLFAAPVDIEDSTRNKRLVDECFPEAFSLLCNKATAEGVQKALQEWVDFEILYFDRPILTS